MKTQIIRVQVGRRIESFCNAAAAESYRHKHGGKIILANNEDPGKGPQVPIAESTATPVRSPGQCGLLGLSTVALNTPGELETAFEANGRKNAPRDTEKIRFALVNFWRGRLGADTDRALSFVKDRHPLLFPERLGQTAGTASNERRHVANEIIHTANEGVFQSLGPFVAA